MRTIWNTGIVALVGLAVAACATTQSAMKPEDAIAARQKLMKEQGAAMTSIQNKLKAGQVEAVSADAQKLAQTAKQIPALFPAGSVNAQTSRAKPEIWQKWSDFEGLAKALEAQANRLDTTAKTGNAQATTAAVTDLGRQTCGSCHTQFRGPEIKK
jgi:cytochrome c556